MWLAVGSKNINCLGLQFGGWGVGVVAHLWSREGGGGGAYLKTGLQERGD